MKLISYFLVFIFLINCDKKFNKEDPKKSSENFTKKYYSKDSINLSTLLRKKADSIDYLENSRSISSIKNVEIDTIIYGKDDKIVLLALLTKENCYSKSGSQYSGECYIAYKRGDIFDNLYQFK